MKICPKCEDEFRDDAQQCSLCLIPLVAETDFQPKAKMAAHEILAVTKAQRFLEGPLDTCREIEKVLLAHDVAAMLEPIKETQEASLGSASIKRYAVLVSEEDMQRAAHALQNRFAAQIEKEGFGVFSDSVVRLDEGDITCPACGFVGALQNGMCPECELFLGEPAG
jgi:hypothetical protein